MSNNSIENKEIYKMYRGKMCMRHTVEFYTPIISEKLGTQMYIGQSDNSEAHKKSMSDININIADVIGENLQVDIGKVETTVLFGDIIDNMCWISDIIK